MTLRLKARPPAIPRTLRVDGDFVQGKTTRPAPAGSRHRLK
ncbi:hypothetical protein OPIT5_13440 [Opitutaceae bacterium TAV5]|nr:hypothetical protein OPIT5_13440 [Opitutaceae bacterium TAV5]